MCDFSIESRTALKKQLIALLLVFIGSGLSLFLEDFIGGFGLPRYLLIAAYLLVILLLYYLLNLPLNFYASFVLEHKFNLSKQKPGDWWMDQLKSGILAYLFSLILISSFYWVLGRFNQWWLVISILWIVFSVVLAKLAPVLIIPLFFKYKKLEDEVLRVRILETSLLLG